VAGKSTKRKIRLIAIAAALSTGGTLIALLPSANAATPPSTGKADAANCQQHKIEVRPDPAAKYKWSVYGNLYAGNGEKVHQWQEEGKPAGKDFVRWNFNYCGDNGWARVIIHTEDGVLSSPGDFRGLKLDRDHCWQIGPPDGEFEATINRC
jgi:hypothetical protein